MHLHLPLGIQHVLVMFTAMVGGPLIVGRLLNLPEETRIAMVSGTMIGCGLATMVSSLGVGFIGMKASEAVGRNPGAATKILVQSILSIAFAEAIVFYALFLVR
mgnify:CR=1 FL=1